MQDAGASMAQVGRGVEGHWGQHVTCVSGWRFLLQGELTDRVCDEPKQFTPTGGGCTHTPVSL